MKNNIPYLFVNINRPISFLCILLLSPFYVSGQLSIGIGAGISKNYLISNQQDGSLHTYDKIDGFTAGIVLQYPIYKSVTLGMEPSLTGKHYQGIRSGYYQGVYQATYNNYIQLPVLLTFSMHNKKLMGGISTGGYYAYWISSRKKGTIPNLSNLSLQDGNYKNVFQNIQSFSYDDPYHFNANLDKRKEFGWVTGLDFQYTLARQFAGFIKARYYYALTNQNKTYSINQEYRYNETLAITAGLIFKIDVHKKSK